MAEIKVQCGLMVNSTENGNSNPSSNSSCTDIQGKDINTSFLMFLVVSDPMLRHSASPVMGGWSYLTK